MAVSVWRARHATKVQIAAALGSVSTASLLDDLAYTSSVELSSGAKQITIIEPEVTKEVVNTMGIDANSFQNQQLDTKPPTLASFEGTLLVSSYSGGLERYIGSTKTIVTTSRRYQIGDTETACSVLVNLNNGTDQINFLFNNAYIVKVGDITAASDGHFEIPVKVVCMAKDFYAEYPAS